MRIRRKREEQPVPEDGVPSVIEVDKRPMVPDAVALLDALAAVQERTRDDTFELDVLAKAIRLTKDPAGNEVQLLLLYIETLSQDVRSVWVYEIVSAVLHTVRTEGSSASSAVVSAALVSQAVNSVYEKPGK